MSEAPVKKRSISELFEHYALLEGCADSSEKIFINSLKFSIGNLQSRTASYVIDDDDISQNHCVIKYYKGVWLIEDHSMSGTYLNGEKLDKHDTYILREGHKIQLGVGKNFTYIFSKTDYDFEHKRNKINSEEDVGTKTSEPLANANSSGKMGPEDYNHMNYKIIQIRSTVIREVPTACECRKCTVPENERPVHLEDLQSGIKKEDQCANKSLLEEKKIVGEDDIISFDNDVDVVTVDVISADDGNAAAENADEDNADEDNADDDNADNGNAAVDNADDGIADDDNASPEERDREYCETQKQIKELQLKVSESEIREKILIDKTMELCDIVETERTEFKERLEQERSAAQQALEIQKRQMQELENQKRQMAEEKNLQEQSRKELEEKLAESIKSQKFEAFVKKELTCGICDEIFIRPVKLNCLHVFCNFCITKWCRKQPICPLCRAPVTVTNPVLVIDSIVNKIMETQPDETKQYRVELEKERQEEEFGWVEKSAETQATNYDKYEWYYRRAIDRYAHATPVCDRHIVEHELPVFVRFPSYSDDEDSDVDAEADSTGDSDCEYENDYDYDNDDMGSQSC